MLLDVFDEPILIEMFNYSIEGVIEDIQQVQDDVSVLDNKVVKTMTTVVSLGEHVIEQDKEMDQVKKDLDILDEKVENVEEDLVVTKDKVEDIDNKVFIVTQYYRFL